MEVDTFVHNVGLLLSGTISFDDFNNSGAAQRAASPTVTDFS